MSGDGRGGFAAQTRRLESLGIQINDQLAQLFANLPYWHKLSRVEQSVRLHHGAVHIHPFENGNGRWSRMLANIWLKQTEDKFVRWPEDTIACLSPIREEYLVAIKAADEYDFAPLIDLHERFLRDDLFNPVRVQENQ